MPLKRSPGLPANLFEAAVVREIFTRWAGDGFLAHSVLLPNIRERNYPNEHDVLLLLPECGFTLDCKKWDRGRYRFPGTGPAEWRRERTQSATGLAESIPSELPNPFHTAFTKAQKFHDVCQEAVPGFGSRRYRIHSLIVLPEHCEFDVGAHTVPGERTRPPFDLLVVHLSELIAALERKAVVEPTFTRAHLSDLERVFEHLRVKLRRDGTPESLHGIQSLRPLMRREPLSPGRLMAYHGRKVFNGLEYEVRTIEKPLHPDEDLVFLSQLVNRSKALYSLQIPGVVNVSLFEEGPEGFVVSWPWFPGDALNDYVQKYGALSASEARTWLSAIARTVQQVHEHEIYHLDLRPESILVDAPSGRHLLTSFARPSLSSAQVSTIALVGYDGSFCAPELQISGRPKPGRPEVDVFALGRLYAFCLLGDAEYRARLSDDGYLDLDGLSPADALLIERATRASPHERYGAVRDYLSALV